MFYSVLSYKVIAANTALGLLHFVSLHNWKIRYE